MPLILGLDASVKKSGFVIFDTDKPDTIVEEKGLLKTSPGDGILVQRLIKQAGQIEDKIKKYKIKYVGMEAPFFGSNSTEVLFALNQYIHKVFFENNSYVICFPPQMLKKLVFPDVSVETIGKPHMIDRAKTMLSLHGHRLAEDVADAYWAGYFGKRYYKHIFEKSLKETDLGDYELGVYVGKHVYQKGPKKGITDYTGILYRENELFFDYEAIKRRKDNAEVQEKIRKAKGRRS